ncbi:MAG TPA: RNA polymerase sigma factor SigJ [Jatrophihabitans sp.]|nr:RNA polymerase sigma factor SigJ [Jatrophihabitans sp.]
MSPRVDQLAAAFQADRARLTRIAYAVLGSYTEAEDVVSDVWLRLVRADAVQAIRDLEAWATIAVGRAALDAYRSARRQRERYVGPWLPEPFVAEGRTLDPADRVTLDETVSFALLVVLESLTPAERTSWVLHELFGMPFAEIADVVGRSPAAVRQLASRARARLRAQAPRLNVDAAEHSRAVTSFLQAAAGGRLAELIAVLDPAVVLTSDGGGQVSAARRPIHGADRVARFVLGIAAKYGDRQQVRPVLVNGAWGLAVSEEGRLTNVMAISVRAGRIARIDLIRAPGKLARGAAIPPR